MMIFSQDKTTLINTDRMSVFNVEPYRLYDSEKEEFVDSKNGEYTITARDSLAGGGWVTLGIYENKNCLLYTSIIRDKCLTELEPEEDDGTTIVGVWFKPLPDEIAHVISKKYHLYI